MPASSSWVTGRTNSSSLAGQLEQALGGAAGDVEEHGVGQRGVGVAQPAGEQRDHAPQQLGPLPRTPPGPARRGSRGRSDGSRARASAERPSPSSRPISPNRSPRSMSATIDSRPSTDLLAMAIRPVLDDVEVLGLGALVEEHVAAAQVDGLAAARHPVELVVVELGEELGRLGAGRGPPPGEPSDGFHGR